MIEEGDHRRGSASAGNLGSPEARLRAAFDRLKANNAEILPKDAEITQNNVAREAGFEPSAFKKSRFKCLIEEIQEHIKNRDRKVLVQMERNAALHKQLANANERIQRLEFEAANLRSLLLSAQYKLLENSREDNAD